jgi:hypothetical protein
VLGRAWRWTREQLAFLLVVAVLVAALVFLAVQPDRWRAGTGVIAVSMLLAALLRVLVPNAQAGMLAVRGRGVDTLAYLVLGGLILAVDIRLHG